MKMLMLTLPFLVRDLIAPEVMVYSGIYCVILSLLKNILLYTRLNSLTQQSTGPSPDPVCTACLTWLIPAMRLWRCSFQCMDWNISTRQSRISQSDLPELYQKTVDFLDILQQYLPDKTGEKAKWNFVKAHSILHKVLEMVYTLPCAGCLQSWLSG